MHWSLERRRMEPAHPLVDDDLDRPGDELSETTVRAALDEGAGGCQHDVVPVAGAGVRRLLVQRQALLEQLSELALPLGERSPPAPAGSLPRLFHLHLHEHRQCTLAKPAGGRLRNHRTAAERDHGRHGRIESLTRELLLDRAELDLAARREDRGDRRRRVPLDLGVEIDERTREAGGNPAAERRLPGAHEADERQMAVLYRGAQSIRSR